MSMSLISEIVLGLAIFSYGAFGVVLPTIHTRQEFARANREALAHVRRVETFRAGTDPAATDKSPDPRLRADIVEALRRLEERAKAAGLTCEALRPERSRRIERDHWRLRQTDVLLTVRGEEGRVRLFIGEIERDEKTVFSAASLTIRPDTRDAGKVQADVKVEIVDEARCGGESCGKEAPKATASPAERTGIAARRLFAPLRVEARATAVTPDPESAIRKYKFVGVMDDGEPRAFLCEEGAASTISVKKGDDIRGWTVVSVNQQGVEVRCEDRAAVIGI